MPPPPPPTRLTRGDDAAVVAAQQHVGRGDRGAARLRDDRVGVEQRLGGVVDAREQAAGW